MLSMSAIESAYTTATELDDKGIAVTAKQGTLLASLVAVTHIDYDPRVTDSGYYVDMNKMSTLTDQASATTGYSEHSARMEESAEFLVKYLNDYLLHTRTVVAPVVDAYAQRLAAVMELVEGTPDAGVNVKVRKGNNILLEPALLDAFSRSKEVIYEALPVALQLPKANDAEVLQLMLTGATTLDAAIGEYYSSYPEGWLASAYERVFAADAMSAVPESVDAYISGRENVPTALLTFLVARKLWNAPPEGTQMALAEYEGAMVALRNQAALRLCHEIDRMNRDDASGVLVSSVRRVDGAMEIEVNQEQYTSYLKAGGTVDALLGNQLQAHPAVLTKELLENKDVFEAAWARHYSKNKSYFDQRRLLRMREAIVVEWDAMACESTEEEFPLSERHVARGLLRRMAEETTPACFDDLAGLAMRLVCRARFYKSPAEKILSGIVRAKANNPGITTREAATISIMEYFYGWLAQCMDVVPAKKIGVFSAQDSAMV